MAQYVEGPYIVEDQPDGTRKVVGYSGQQAAPQSNTLITKQAAPDYQYQEPKARLDNQLTEAQIRKAALDASQASATQPYDVRKAAADAAKAEAEAAALLARQAKRGDNNPAGKLAGILKSIDDIAVDAKDNGGFGETGYWGSWLRDRPGTAAYDLQRKIDKIDANNAFSELQQMRENSPTGGALGGIAVEELKMLKSTVASLDPNMSQEEFLAQLQTARDHYADLIGRIDPTNEYAAPVDYRDDKQVAALAAGKNPPAAGSQGPDRSAPLPTGPRFGGPQGDPSGFVPYGSTTRRMDNPQWAGVNEAVKGMIIAGQSPDAIRAYLGERGINTNVEGLNQAANYFRKTGKRDFRVNVDDIEVPMSGFEQFRNNAPQTAVGAGVASAANAVALGVPQALAPEQMQYIRDQNPFPSFVGDVAGIVGATSGIGTVGNSLARSLAPRALTGGGRLGNAARAVAPDAAYGAAYGGITEGDPLTGAATAALGSGAGQLLGKGAQKLFQGARLDPNAQILRDAGMQNLTIGQSLGGFAKSLEDAGTSAPILGDIINARRAEGLQEFNLGRLNEAGAPIGATVTETGEDGLNQLMTQVGSAYDNATAGINVPLDPQFAADMQAAAAAGQRLPPDYQVRFDKIGQNRVGPIFDAGQMTGETYQQAMRGLKGARSSAGQAAPGFEQDYRDAVTAAMTALRGQMERGGGQNVIEGLAKADNANRLGKTLQNAMAAAKNDAGGAGVQIFTPAQLNTAAYAAQKKFPGPRPFADMTDAAQMVLPSKIPDSGTARRGASLLLPVSLGGTGAGLDYYLTQTPGEGGAVGLAAGALLLAGGSKGGQKALDKLLFKRPDAVRKFGGIFGRRKLQKGLGAGVVTAPLLVEQ